MPACKGVGGTACRRLPAGTLAFFSAALAAVPLAADGQLPSPLTLEHALALADEDHPDLALARSGIEHARARLLEVESREGVRAYIELAPERAVPSTGGGSLDDSRMRLVISKQLFDFGRTRSLAEAAAREIESRDIAFLDARNRRRLEIMTRFFDVLLADLRHAVDREETAFHFVGFDRLREQHALGQVSDVELLEAENRYLEAAIARAESEQRRQTARALLAVALNRPDERLQDLAPPALPGLDRETPPYQDLLEQALKANPMALALRREVEAARQALAAERARRRPTLSAELEAADYERALASRSDRRAALNLRIPLYQGGEENAAIARAAAVLAEREARLRKYEYELRRVVLDLRQELETLRIKRNAARQRTAFRDLYLDRRRALYEMEVQVRLGDALTRLTEAQWLAAKADFELALVWARIDALTGKLVHVRTEEPIP